MNVRTVQVMYPNKKLRSKSYKILVFLLKTLHLLFNLDLGFVTHKSLKFRLISYLFLIIHCVLGLFIFLGIYNGEVHLYSSWSVQFFVVFLVMILLLSFFKRGTTFEGFQKSLEEIDVQIQEDLPCYHAELKLVLTIFFIYIVRLLITGYYCFVTNNEYCLDSKWDIYGFVFLSSCLDICLACYSFVLYSLYLRLSKLSPKLKTNDDVDFILRLYKQIVDTVEKYKRAFDPMFMLMLLSNVLQIMTTMCYLLIKLRNQPNMMMFLLLSVELCYLLEVLMFTVSPALTAEMLTTQAEKIKITLHDKLLLDVQHKDSLLRFIQYVEARPCRFRVWKLIPLTADLLGMVLSFCVTYLIVIIQFTIVK